MSYIYEALKRAEDENARGVAAAGRVRRRRFFATPSRAWLWALIGVLAANAAVIVTLTFVRRSPAPTVTVAGLVESPTADARNLTPSTPPGIVTASPAVPAAPTVATARPARPATTTKPGVQPPAPPVPAAARADSAPATPTAVTPETASARPEAPAPVAPAISPPATAPGATPSPPAADASKLHVQVVVYSDVPAERMVIINGRRYAEGQKIDPETVVERITPEGAVVSRKGQSETLISGR